MAKISLIAFITLSIIQLEKQVETSQIDGLGRVQNTNSSRLIQSINKRATESLTRIILITPTYARSEQMAELTRLSQTLQYVKNIFWIVIEDAEHTNDAISQLLQRSGIRHVHFSDIARTDTPRREWKFRNFGLKYVRERYRNYNGPAVIYFADDDNTYDLRLFDEYIRNVKGIGVWAVGLVGNALVEAPVVENGKVKGWHVVFMPSRKFGVDLAGFAINLRLILANNVTFIETNADGLGEEHFLTDFNFPVEQVEPFGHDRNPKELLVWHTKTTGC